MNQRYSDSHHGEERLHPMLPFGLCHRTGLQTSAHASLPVAEGLGCVGRGRCNDPARPPFDGNSAAGIATAPQADGQELQVLSERHAAYASQKAALEGAGFPIAPAAHVGAGNEALKPAMADSAVDRGDQRSTLSGPKVVLQPILKNDPIWGRGQPLRCANSTLRMTAFAGTACSEVFDPKHHDMNDPAAEVTGSIAFINVQLAGVAAGAA